MSAKKPPIPVIGRGIQADWIWDDAAFTALVEQMPKRLSRVMNTAMKKCGRRFMELFTRTYLKGRPGIKIFRKGKKKKKAARNAIALPAAARNMGFYGKIFGMRNLHGKEMRVGTSNPQAVSHIQGATIYPTRFKMLRLHIRHQAHARALGVPLGSILYAKRIRIPARLKFLEQFVAFAPEFQRIMTDHLAAYFRKVALRNFAKSAASRASMMAEMDAEDAGDDEGVEVDVA